MKSHIGKFESVAAFGNRLQGLPSNHSGRRFAGRETMEQSLAFCRNGDNSLVPQAEKLLAKFTDRLEVPQRTYMPDVCGSYPIVPEAIAGYPLSMRRRVEMESDSAEIHVYVNITCSMSEGKDTFVKRGTAVLALVWALSRIRPVSLYVMSTLDGPNFGEDENVTVCKINTQPLDLATACYALTSPGFLRNVCFTYAERISPLGGFAGSWPQGYNHRDPDKYHAGLRQRLGAPKDSLFIRPVFSGDLSVTNSEKWIAEQLAKFTNRDD